MCEQIKKWADFVRYNRDLIMTFVGIIAAGYIYIDYKDFTIKSQQIQLEQTVALKEITIRLTHLETKLQ